MDLSALNLELAALSTEEVVRKLFALDPAGTVLACSASMEDTVLLHMLAEAAKSAGKKPRAFVLDTGRLPEETYQVLEDCRQKYHFEFEMVFPESQDVEKLLRAKGPFSFYESIENRKECCHIRKVLPLKRALSGATLWITGMRREQSVTRADVPFVELDQAHGGILKANPLALWTEKMVYDYASAHNVPVHPLHRRGFPSIGCEPCTRAIQPGEDFRAGRWWWENADQKECGLHVKS